MIKKLTIIIAAAILAGSHAHAQGIELDRFYTFECDDVPATISAGNGRLSISGKHFREGEHSLRWDFSEKDVLSLRQDLMFEHKDTTGKDTYLSSFVFWVYNEKPFKEKMTVEFLKEGKICSWFEMGMDFTGWRGACISYERDMQGCPATGMDEIRMSSPASEGTIYIDHLVTASKIDSRFQSPDVHLPFVNKDTKNHWLLVYRHSLMEPDIELTPLTDMQVADMEIMSERFRSTLYEPKPFTAGRMEKLRKGFGYYRISYDGDGAVTGRPIFMVRHSEIYERFFPNWRKQMFAQDGNEFDPFFELMKAVAIGYCDAKEHGDKEELKRMFLSMYDYITDLGVAAGSSWGYCHHYGYNIRGLYPAYFLMKDVLKEAGKLKQAEETMRWYAITNEVYPKPAKNGIVIDQFNTHMEGRIASMLIMEDSPEKVRYLRSFSRWLDYGSRPSDGLSGSFKTDGTCFHHCNHYPAYATGGLDGAVNALYCLSGTGFRISEYAHSTIKNVLLTMRFYCNTHQWPLVLSGRHPNGKNRLVPIHYGLMAKAGTPDGSSAIDTEMAKAFLRLTAPLKKKSRYEKKLEKELLASGITPEDTPQGSKSLGYGCTLIHRRGNWMAVFRGHSRYIWTSEQYLNANFYGRHLGYGALEIMTGPEGAPVTLATSGWKEKGFDWNRIPGATYIHQPFEKLRAKVLNVDTFSGFEEMLYSDEAFAGGLSSEGWNGNFGMILHEHDKYDGSMRARKSYHVVDNVIVCLGSDITNTEIGRSTETAVFQLSADTDQDKEHWSKASSSDVTFIDRNCTGYYIGKASRGNAKFIAAYPQVTVWERKEGQSQGDWVSLVIDHGKAPEGASYEYAVMPGTDSRSLKKFSRNPSYKVLRQDRKAHIVEFDAGISSYVFFERPDFRLDGVVCSADTSCLVMTTQKKDYMNLSVAQPDLALYRGGSDELFDQEGKRVERSIYSRPWKDSPSLEIPVSVTLKGSWDIIEASEYVSSRQENGNTVITVRCSEARSYDIPLKKQR